ncbi:DksA/TraR family C4-type zinc finger protein [Zobellella aerophila]|uniref:DksA/TraR family C4-type zinc finger protein n=1 Tax=Zobellella aerophila TaxID=870480 RepID=A0ABP6VES3_9GAMM
MDGGLEEEQGMASGWAKDGAVQDQIDASVEDAVKEARNRLGAGESLTHCEECDAVIPEARRKALPGVSLCVGCQSALEKQRTTLAAINRRGSKDSQLR